MTRSKYRFRGRAYSGTRYVWEARIPGSPLVELIECDVHWFWKGNPK